MTDRMDRTAFIESLAGDLRPTGRRLPATWTLLLWLATSWAVVSALTLATGEMRSGVGEQFLSSPRFILECVLGLAAGVLAIRSAVELAVPGRARRQELVPLSLAVLTLWVGSYVYGLYDPAVEPSMLGKREHCYYETLLFSSVPFALGLILARRRMPLQRAWVGLLIGVASAAVPALIMQWACMYEPAHILGHHLLPIAVVGAAGAIAGRLLLVRL